MPEPTTTVTIRIVGVNESHIDRLATAIKTHLTRFGNKVEVTHDLDKKKGK